MGVGRVEKEGVMVGRRRDGAEPQDEDAEREKEREREKKRDVRRGEKREKN